MKKAILLLITTLVVIFQLVNAQQLAEQLLQQSYVQIQHAHQFTIAKGWTRFFEHAGIKANLIANVLSTKRAKITLALHSSNLEVLNSKFESITNPESPDFRQYLTMEQVAKLTSPHSSHKSFVMEYIKSIPDAKIIEISTHENFVTIELSLSSIDRYFKTKMTPFINQVSGKIIYRSEEGFALPQKLSTALKTIVGIHHFPTYQHKLKKSQPKNKNSRLMQDGYDTTPQGLYKRYNITLPSSTSKNNLQAVASFLGQYVSMEDLAQFQQTFNLPKVVPTISGPNEDDEPGTEAALDIQYITAMGYLVNTTINSTPNTNDDSDVFMTWIIKQQKLGDKSALVHSISYGAVEKDMPDDFKSTLDTEFQKLTITGRSILIASGDDGARCNSDGSAFQPEWPTSSPYVTSVGASRPSDVYFERSVSWGGGGFSNYYPRPSYQSEAVASYLSGSNVPDNSYFNVHGRAYPDVAALGVDYQIVVNGQVQSVDGTSASTPCFAGIVSLLNDLRLKAGKKPLGFLNPWLYKVVFKTRNAMFDITQGNNGVSPCPGFSAVKGFDPISGIGVPNFAVLSQLAVQSP